jgi:hypothetical protein
MTLTAQVVQNTLISAYSKPNITGTSRSICSPLMQTGLGPGTAGNHCTASHKVCMHVLRVMYTPYYREHTDARHCAIVEMSTTGVRSHRPSGSCSSMSVPALWMTRCGVSPLSSTSLSADSSACKYSSEEHPQCSLLSTLIAALACVSRGKTSVRKRSICPLTCTFHCS